MARPSPYNPPATTTTCSESGFFPGISCVVFPPLSRPNRYAEAMPNVGPWEIILLLLLALLLFGAKRLPEIGRSMGRGMREFKDSVSGKDRDDDEPAELPMQTTDATIAARERERDPA
jgi:sec-independent protein translocase protein TatA